ncbi:hypothetical protein KM043_000157 [Ampulex compressa]|nr:hypothetical protein KM043_000157 [Ampulex compressa]
MYVDYYVAQLLMGHGAFNKFRRRIGESQTAACWECGEPEDDANHAMFHCPAGEAQRKTLELELGVKIDPDNLVAAATKSPSTWRALRAFAFETIRPREEKERREERMYRG